MDATSSAVSGGSADRSRPAGRDTVLVRVSGRDHPGITAGLLDVLATHDADVYDMEQVVVRGRLSLGLLVSVPPGTDVLKDLLFHGWQSDVQLDFEVVEDTPTPRQAPRHVVTVIGARLSPGALSEVAHAIAAGGGNIDRIVRLSRYPVISYELVVTHDDADRLRAGLVDVAHRHPIDLAVQREDLGRRAKRLVCLDVDSTLIQDEVIELLAEEAGRLDEVREVTLRAMRGEVEFADALRQRVAALAGLDEAVLQRVADRVRLTPGARTFVRTLRRLGFRVAIVSGGFSWFTDRLRADLGLDHAIANTLEVVDGRVTGRLAGRIVDRAAKADWLREIAAREQIPLSQTVAVGDGANDLDMLATAGLGIAFNAKPVVREAADTSVSVPYLDAILFLLGIPRQEVEDADRADPDVPTEGLIPIPGIPPV